MQNLQSELDHFTGTESYHYQPHLNALQYTDGVQHFAKRAGAYWLLDIIGTEVLPFSKQEEFIALRLNVQDSAAWLTADDGNGRIFYNREIKFTDTPAGVWKFYLIDSILLLPSEY
jgi:hypothetical protein